VSILLSCSISSFQLLAIVQKLGSQHGQVNHTSVQINNMPMTSTNNSNKISLYLQHAVRVKHAVKLLTAKKLTVASGTFDTD